MTISELRRIKRMCGHVLKARKKHFDDARIKHMIKTNRAMPLERQAGNFKHLNLHEDVRLRCMNCSLLMYKCHIVDWAGDTPICPCCSLDQIKIQPPVIPIKTSRGADSPVPVDPKKKRKKKSIKSTGGIPIP